jgi:hypothetical protein
MHTQSLLEDELFNKNKPKNRATDIDKPDNSDIMTTNRLNFILAAMVRSALVWEQANHKVSNNFDDMFNHADEVKISGPESVSGGKDDNCFDSEKKPSIHL